MTLQLDVPAFPPDAPVYPPLENRSAATGGDGITIGQILATLWRRRVVLLTTIFGITVLGFIIIKLLTPTFGATVIIVLAAPQDSVVDIQQAYLQRPDSDAIVRSDGDALQSRSLVDRVIDRENLMDDPEFNLYAAPFKPNLITRLGIGDYLPHFLRTLFVSKPLDPTMLTPAQLKYNVATQVLKAWDVEPDAKTYTVKMTFTSVDSEKAARIANAFVDEYMNTQIDAQAADADFASSWLAPRLAALRKKVEDADRAVEEYKEAHNIIDYPSQQPEENTLALQEVQNLEQDLSGARTKRAELEAAQQEVQKLLIHPDQALSVPSVADAAVVENARVQEAAAAAHLAELTATYGDRHPLVIAAKGELEQLHQRLNDEVARTLKQLDVQMRQAQTNEVQLQARLDQLTKIRHTESSVLPGLEELETEQTAAKTIYDAFVQGSYRAVTQDGVPTRKGQIIQHADPVDWPTFPNTPIFMAVIFIASTMIAIAIAYVFEAGDKSFRSAGDLEAVGSLPVLGITLLAARSGIGRLIQRRAPVSHQILAQPNSALSETVRLVGTAIAFSRTERPPKIIMVTSAVPGEGKTTFALMLARLSAQSGKRVLVIEAEMRQPSFSAELSSIPAKGLAEYLVGRATLDEVTGIDAASGAHFIAVRERSKFPSELLGSAQMRTLLHQASLAYDLVVLDTPPVTITADALQLGDAIDAGILVVKWGGPPQHFVLDAIKKLRAANVPLAGAVMTQVDGRRYGSYGLGQLPFDYAKSYYAAP